MYNPKQYLIQKFEIFNMTSKLNLNYINYKNLEYFMKQN